MAGGKQKTIGAALAVMAAGWLGGSAPVMADDDLAAAQKQFVTSCGTCHVVDPKAGPRQGPNLAEIIGRKAGTYPGYKYSAALANAGFTWDADSLDKWISNAQAFRPGTVMPYRQADPAKRAKIIAYLKSLSVPK
ncbi:c-type cytochrome [Labrys neptuniae]